MNINYIVSGLELSGGFRVIVEHANRLKERGHEVNIVSPLIVMPTVFKIEWKRLQQFMRDNKEKWEKDVKCFDLKIKPIKIPSINPLTAKLSENIIPDANIIFATSWDTAEFVARLNPSKGNKFYLIQHYEVWDVLNNLNCWVNAKNLVEDSNKSDRDKNQNKGQYTDKSQYTDKIFWSLPDLTLNDPELHKKRKMVEDTYHLPLSKITISNLLKKLIEKKFDEKIIGLVPNGVNFNQFYKEENTSHKSEQPLKVTMPYMATPYKGAADGIKALKIVRKAHPETEFVLYGSKSFEDIPPWINFFNQLLNDDELRRLYNSSDIFVNPSWAEGFCLPPLEAMACGCAVVSTEVGAVKDYSINGKTILTSPPQNPRLLAENIIRLIEDETLRKRIADNGQQHVQKFNWEYSIDKLEQILKTSSNS